MGLVVRFFLGLGLMEPFHERLSLLADHLEVEVRIIEGSLVGILVLQRSYLVQPEHGFLEMSDLPGQELLRRRGV